MKKKNAGRKMRRGKRVMVRKKMEMKRRLKYLHADGQMKVMKMTMLAPRVSG